VGQNKGNRGRKTFGHQGQHHRGGRVGLSQAYREKWGVVEQDRETLLWGCHEVQQDL